MNPIKSSACFAFVAVMVAAFVMFGCTRNDPLYCPRHADDQANCPNDAPDAGGCSADEQCSGATAVCDTGQMTCVQCTSSEHAACSGTTPTCGSDDSCRACSAHAECASNACLPDGACGSDNVAYVSPEGTDNSTCTQEMPCTTVAKALATNRPFVKFHGTTDEAVSVGSGRTVTFLADAGAKLTRSSGSGPVIDVEDDQTSLSIFDLAVSDAPNSASGRGIFMGASGTPSVSLTRVTLSNDPGGGVSSSGGSLTISRSTISNNTPGGGVSVGGGTFAIVGNVFFGNGNNTNGTVGGISITTAQNASNRLEFNSFAKNTTMDGIAPAIQCVAGTFAARNNILSDNGTLSNMNQTGGTCTHTYSIVRPGLLPPGTGNAAEDPKFANTTTGDLHIATGSPARHAADPNSDLAGIASLDIDGDTRVAPADKGADQVP